MSHFDLGDRVVKNVPAPTGFNTCMQMYVDFHESDTAKIGRVRVRVIAAMPRDELKHAKCGGEQTLAKCRPTVSF